MNNKQSLQAITIWICILGCLFYCFETLLEVLPTTIVADLMKSFQINATQAGLFDSFYFITYACLQIPGGLLLDYFGPRKVLTIAASVITISFVILASAQDYSVALFSRLLAGLGSCFGLIGAMFLVARLVPAKHLATLLGFTLMIGLSGGLLQGIFSSLVQWAGWRQSVFVMAIVAVAFALLFFVSLKKQSGLALQQKIDFQVLMHSLRSIVQKPYNWLLAFYGGLMYVPTGTIGTLWGVPFLHAHFPNINTVYLATINSMIFLGWIVGSPIVGWFVDHIKNKMLILLWGAIGCLITLLIISLSNSLSVSNLFLLFFFIGLFSSCGGTTFAIAAINNPNSSPGTIVGFINMLGIIPSIIIAPLFGRILDHYWSGVVMEGVRTYSLVAYQKGMLLEFIILGLAVLIALICMNLTHLRKL